jgi:NAD(P)-dependent dehydrogenase (short-subunit alcohol dehydrogenase family)
MVSANLKVALVTGGGSGIGRAASRALAEQGFAMVLAGRRREPLEALVSELAQSGKRAIAVPTDVSDAASVHELFAQISAQFGRLDVLFNNAGTGAPGLPLEDLTPAQWRSVIDVNVTGTFLCTQEAFRLMKAQNPRGGRIINNGSISAWTPRPNSAPYAASKHAVSGLTKATALDGRKYDIACGQIDIGNAESDMAAQMKRGVLQADGSIAVEPTISLVHVAQAVAYMASLPLDANVLSLTVMATKMPFVGRG